MKECFCGRLFSVLLAIVFPVWVGVILYYHYPRLWQAVKDPLAALSSIPPQYMGLGVVGAGLLVLAILVSHFGIAYLLSLRSNPSLKGCQRLAFATLAAAFVLGLAWSLYRYPGLRDAVANLLLLSIIIPISGFVGRKMLCALGAKPDSPLEELVFSVGLGLGLFTYVVLALALLGWLYAWVAWLIVIVLGIAFALSLGQGLLTDPPRWAKVSRPSLLRLGPRLSVKNRAAEIFLLS
ncbi:MAG: hypothetical protein ABIN58_05100, partial [candidate division WOR-3 bacterium]